MLQTLTERKGYSSDAHRRFVSVHLFMLYQSSILLLPELVLGRLVQSLTVMLDRELDELSKRRSTVGEFCDKVDVVRDVFDATAKVRNTWDRETGELKLQL